jgi:hypothetical protein
MGRISVVVGIRTDIHPTIVGVQNDAGVRVIRRIVVGIARRETQTHACYERIPKAKASAPKAWCERGGAKAWSKRGSAEAWAAEATRAVNMKELPPEDIDDWTFVFSRRTIGGGQRQQAP